MCCHLGLGGAHGTPSDRDSEGIEEGHRRGARVVKVSWREDALIE